MGTMDVISLDDTAENDASLFVIDESPRPFIIDESPRPFIIDESPRPDIMKEVNNKPTSPRKRRKSKKRGSMKKKKLDLDYNAISKANWVVISGSRSADSLQTQSNSRTSSSNSQVSKILNGSGNSRNNKMETIVIPSEDDESEVEEITTDVIELSDEEVATVHSRVNKSNFICGVNNRNFCGAIRNGHSKFSVFQEPKKSVFQESKEFMAKYKASNSSTSEESSPSSSDNMESPEGLRPIVIDGSNVAFGHGRGQFSSKGLKICCDYFLKRGHKVKAFVPQFRRRHRATSDTHILDQMEKDKVVIFTPSRKVNGKQVVSYDDRYIVEYACKCGGIIVSRDNYNDLVSENHEWKKTIEQRLLMYTFVDDMIMFPQDPLGRDGPCLDEFLSFPPKGASSKVTKRGNITIYK